jgi:hypothetical protein
VDESFNVYRTMIPSKNTLPNIADPPDSPSTGYLHDKISPGMQYQVKKIVNDACKQSAPQYSIVTLHGKMIGTLPKTHVALHIVRDSLTNRQVMGYIPDKVNLLYEIFLSNKDYEKYRNHLREFIASADNLGLQYMITIPECYVDNLRTTSAHVEFIDVQRPFHMVQYVASTT